MGSAQAVLFDADLSDAAMRAGMDTAAQGSATALDVARHVALTLAYERGVITMDDVQERLIKLGVSPRQLGNAAGSVFDGPHWRRMGYQKSVRVSNRSRVVARWALRPDARRIVAPSVPKSVHGGRGGCACGCGRSLGGRQQYYASDSCRMRGNGR